MAKQGVSKKKIIYYLLLLLFSAFLQKMPGPTSKQESSY